MAARKAWRMSAIAVAIAGLVAACGRGPQPSVRVPDIPVYPGARLTDGQDEPDRDPIDTYTVANVSEATVLAWYREQMPKHGWRAATSDTDNVVLYLNAEGCYGFVMATQSTNGRDVLLQLSRQRPGTACAGDSPTPAGEG